MRPLDKPSTELAAAALAAALFTGEAHAHEGPGPVGGGLGVNAPTGLTLEASVARHQRDRGGAAACSVSG